MGRLYLVLSTEHREMIKVGKAWKGCVKGAGMDAEKEGLRDKRGDRLKFSFLNMMDSHDDHFQGLGGKISQVFAGHFPNQDAETM